MGDLSVLIWGTDDKGAPFSQSARASNISGSGALLSLIEHPPRCGDLIGISYEGKNSRFRVIWVRDSCGESKIQVAVHRLENECCPWEACLLANC